MLPSESGWKLGCRIALWGTWLFAITAVGALVLAVQARNGATRPYVAVGFAFVSAAAALSLGMVYLLVCSRSTPDDDDPPASGSARH